jgi:hypothetical protein
VGCVGADDLYIIPLKKVFTHVTIPKYHGNALPS